MKKNYLILSILTGLSLLLLFYGCNTGGKEDEKNTITIKGSETMELLAGTWAEEFMKKNEDINVSVKAGDTETGISSLLDKTADIACASIKISEEEEKLAEEKNIKIKEYTVARDAIAVVVNPENSITELSMEEIKEIFTGKLTDWKEVNGEDEEISVYSREAGSGTSEFFREYVLNNENYTEKANILPLTYEIIKDVSEDRGGIGYMGLGYALISQDKVKIIGITEEEGTTVIPDKQTVYNGTYPISRVLYIYTKEDCSENIKKFVQFCLSSEGQAIVNINEYIPIIENMKGYNTEDENIVDVIKYDLEKNLEAEKELKEKGKIEDELEDKINSEKNLEDEAPEENTEK